MCIDVYGNMGFYILILLWSERCILSERDQAITELVKLLTKVVRFGIAIVQLYLGFVLFLFLASVVLWLFSFLRELLANAMV